MEEEGRRKGGGGGAGEAVQPTYSREKERACRPGQTDWRGGEGRAAWARPGVCLRAPAAAARPALDPLVGLKRQTAAGEREGGSGGNVSVCVCVRAGAAVAAAAGGGGEERKKAVLGLLQLLTESQGKKKEKGRREGSARFLSFPPSPSSFLPRKLEKRRKRRDGRRDGRRPLLYPVSPT